jgi:rhodanese-related sulfurtransferase
MKKIILIALTAVTLLSACTSETGAISNVGVEEFRKQISSVSGVIIDVRTPEEFNAGHVENAININVDSSDFQSKISELDKNLTYFVYCKSGRRSTLATDQMADSGFTSLLNLNGGFSDLANSGISVSKN